MLTITMKHRGTFSVSCANDNQCGYVGKQEYDYAVEIVAFEGDLQKQNGFILDTEDINHLFDSITEVRSGEERAIESALDLEKLLEKRGVPFAELHFEIWGSNKTSFVAKIKKHLIN